MLMVAKRYQAVIDEITAKKEYKMRHYELTDEEWQILDDLIYVLRVSTTLFGYLGFLLFTRSTKMQLFFSPRTEPQPLQT